MTTSTDDPVLPDAGPPVGAVGTRRFRRFAIVVAGLAVAAGGALAASGAAWPRPGIILLFAALGWIAVNRYAFFPSEMSVTAESAVLMAAVVVFASDAPLLGPSCVAALVGVLDAVHWEQRAFARMAYNGAYQVLAVLAAAVTFEVVAPDARSALEVTVAAVAASVTFGAVSVACGSAVLRVYAGMRWRRSVSHLVALDWIVLPFGVVGAAAAWLAGAQGWWALPAILVPLSFVPPLVFAPSRLRRADPPAGVRRRIATTTIAAGLVALAPAARGFGDVGVGAVFGAVLVILVGSELRAGPEVRVPPLVAVLVAIPLAADAAVAPAAVAATVAIAVGVALALASVDRAGDRKSFVRAVVAVMVVAAVVFVAQVVPRAPTSRTTHVAIAAWVAAAVVGAVACALSREGRRRLELARFAWASPVVSAAVGMGLAVREFGVGVASVPAVGVPFLACVLVVWASPPWRSGVLVAWWARARWSWRRRVMVAMATGASTSSIALVMSPSVDSRVGVATVAMVLVESMLALAGAGARQWTFAPRARAHRGILLVVAAVVALPAPGLAGGAPVTAAVLLASAASLAVAIGWAAAGRGDDAVRAGRACRPAAECQAVGRDP